MKTDLKFYEHLMPSQAAILLTEKEMHNNTQNGHLNKKHSFNINY